MFPFWGRLVSTDCLALGLRVCGVPAALPTETKQINAEQRPVALAA